jgi:citrate lyase subunit beta/citryl-CoA lyase
MNRAARSHPRSYLFVPADRPERFEKAIGSGADAVIFDLEDAVAPERKSAARAALRDWFARSHNRDVEVVVRVNDDASPWFEDDLMLLWALRAPLVMLPKSESAGQLARVAAAAPGMDVIALVETARGVLAVEDIARAAPVKRLAFGTLDYALDLGLPDDPRGLLYPASRIALASRAAGLPAPIGGVTPAFDDDDALRGDVAFDRACGFGAKLCIHPRQVAPLHALLAPSTAQCDWAHRVLAAAESGAGAVQVDGKMVDRPVVLRAREILRLSSAATHQHH